MDCARHGLSKPAKLRVLQQHLALFECDLLLERIRDLQVDVQHLCDFACKRARGVYDIIRIDLERAVCSLRVDGIAVILVNARDSSDNAFDPRDLG